MTKEELVQWRRTPRGKIISTYYSMRKRVNGKQQKWHHYKGMPLCSRKEFYAWARFNKQFWTLFNDWQDAGYPTKTNPSIHRIDNAKGYTIDNMTWLTLSENSRAREYQNKAPRCECCGQIIRKLKPA